MARSVSRQLRLDRPDVDQIQVRMLNFQSHQDGVAEPECVVDGDLERHAVTESRFSRLGEANQVGLHEADSARWKRISKAIACTFRNVEIPYEVHPSVLSHAPAFAVSVCETSSEP
eukprot:CAMPEP_0168488240 /NCGR_PEP_ID=MMETSP0228-20121227/68048_1 /TAXON_ID=133427 /ORGANISM="Protoceratium reticulatum, Strain CCCM 535 (=CCMP 1889)" /LENGTH=115 /DNA_ID=CAMNT_0008504879 /DNA_START=20 /DNA_END=368 /DNA_ORIENTATION=-